MAMDEEARKREVDREVARERSNLLREQAAEQESRERELRSTMTREQAMREGS